MSKTTLWRVLRKRLVFKPYRIQLNVCNHGEHYETLCIILALTNQMAFCCINCNLILNHAVHLNTFLPL
jgi:hypothetical protein